MTKMANTNEGGTRYSRGAIILPLPKSMKFLVLGGHTLLPNNSSEQFAQQPLQNGDIETEYHPTPGFTLFLQFHKTSYVGQTQPE